MLANGLKEYEAVAHINNTKVYYTVYARSRDEAWKQVWALTDADDVYLEEVSD